MEIPSDLLYTKEHEWARLEDGVVTVGITTHAQEQLGDIVYVELPEKGASFAAGEEFGTVESVKAVSELYLPVDGEVTEINEKLEDSPEVINEDPYGDGWLVRIRISDSAQLDDLMKADAYQQFVEAEAG